jgi:hypothetical protein
VQSHVIYPVTRAFALIRRTQIETGEQSFEILGVYLDEEQAHVNAHELNGALGASSDHFFSYVRTALHDPREDEAKQTRHRRGAT